MTSHKIIVGTAVMFGLWTAGVSIGDAQPESPFHASRLIAQATPRKPIPAAKAALAARKLAEEEKVVPADAAPFEDGAALVLNLKPLYRSVFATLPPDHARYTDFLGRQVIDGVPFLIEGNVILYGQMLVERGSGDNRHNPRVIRGVRVGRSFEELHLIHETAWPDLEGSPVAIVTLHYRDGTTADLPIIFGAHVRDGMRLLTEENETLTDPDSKVIWRGPGPGSEEMHAFFRLFKSTLRNPQPGKVVETLDLKSAGEPQASYKLIAATVTPRDPARPVTPPLPSEVLRPFDGRLVVEVIDAASQRSVPNAVITQTLNIDGINLIGALLLTSAEGEATVRYPTESTATIWVRARKESTASAAAECSPGTTHVTLELSPVLK